MLGIIIALLHEIKNFIQEYPWHASVSSSLGP